MNSIVRSPRANTIRLYLNYTSGTFFLYLTVMRRTIDLNTGLMKYA